MCDDSVADIAEKSAGQCINYVSSADSLTIRTAAWLVSSLQSWSLNSSVSQCMASSPGLGLAMKRLLQAVQTPDDGSPLASLMTCRDRSMNYSFPQGRIRFLAPWISSCAATSAESS